MRTLPTGLLLSAALLTMVLPMATAETTPADAPVQFGMDANSVAAQKAAGVAPDYGTFWIGPWTLSSGWGGPDASLTSMKNAGVTPAIHFYYWGDDISVDCVENGCYSSLHNAQKDRAGWEKLGTQLTDHLDAKMGGEPVVVFLESEFNKGGIEKYEPFDGYMAAMAAKIHAGYPNAIVVLGFGNWGSTSWGTFDRAAAESDMVGIQGMRGSTKQNEAGMYNLYEGLLAGVKTLETKFPGKPIMLTDIAVSSYPDATYSSVQAGVLKEVLDNLPTLKAHGVEALIYRSWRDSKMDPANYYGEAESHWGLALADNTQKAAGKVWVDGVKAERSGASPAPTTTTTTSTAPQTTTTSTSAAPKSTTTTTTASGASAKVTPSGNEWWVQAGVATTKTVTKVEAKVGSNAYVALNKESYGWAKSIHATKGTMVQFRLTASDGSVATTPAQAWLVEMSAKTASFGTASSGTTTTAAKTTTTTAPATTTSATTTTAAPKPSSSTTTTTAAKTTTSTTSTTTAPPTSTTAPTTTTTTTAFKASFSPKSMADNTRVEVGVTANKPIAKVDAKVTIGTTVGSYVQLEQVSPGVYAKPMNAPDGAKVTIRATSTTGETYTSIGYTWG